MASEIDGRPAERDSGVEDSRAIQVNGDARAMSGGGDGFDLLRSAARSAVTVVRVFQADEAGHRDVDVTGADVLTHLIRCEEATLGLDGEGLDATEYRGPADLVVEDVRVRVEDDLLTGSGLREHRHQIALGARGDEQRGVLAHPPRRQFLEAANGRVFFPHVVAN